MLSVLQLAWNGVSGFGNRLTAQGWRAAVIWLVGHGVPRLTGIPLATYSRITPQLYVGAQIRRSGRQRLESWGINSSVNMRSEYDDMAHGLALQHHCYLPTPDGYAPTVAQIRTGVAFIQRAVTAGEKVYIHCRSGIGRAPTMAAAYLISHGYSLEEAIRLIKKARPFIQLSPQQVELLKHVAENQETA